jgi:hypothetical protein
LFRNTDTGFDTICFTRLVMIVSFDVSSYEVIHIHIRCTVSWNSLCVLGISTGLPSLVQLRYSNRW